ncbi:cytochrome c maturation protein CcmE [Caldimonas thermodepolymerans]|jgi:Cytochrome c-type biogenesis protein CcmE|uniref:Cytochrome c-type biogenesis protein CcmE n=1 Tax=Caldimonas thermodepolymerans TaxID=215580 RepID=A0A2S5T084_9BURK|nr:cytochrome c maturation protein CcmE [Caldimonas thermodepolymerans]PPE68435.1 cytochrome c maturation protein CcmE [Caldimonas thermodepolymerans]QPC30184.1 cytochrome c maturation protein CcmE [Caldimonas thermodepolymerans]RDI00566.1 cytochrome c-type biogenesis protein CcmE [Caldimonas thermodepolymerans]TCP07155.1 cytochrome c-type biogenesis protein CcmE [Caldimonas thermodepolymerans]UZG42939.1 cytochrome c maturation protein CcmE [Caldimonas thermodepolymerans]
MTPRRRRLATVLGLLATVALAATLVVQALRSHLVFYYSPSQVAAREAPAGRAFRIGGLVEPGSVRRDGLKVQFVVTDTAQSLPVRYEGPLPDLFAEGQGVVAQGRLGEDGVFLARQVLAKHDEDYVPPPAAQAVRQAAHGGRP